MTLIAAAGFYRMKAGLAIRSSIHRPWPKQIQTRALYLSRRHQQPAPHNDKWHLHSGEQSWPADHVVVCAGMGSRGLLATLNLSVPLESQRGYHLQAPHPGVTLSRIVVLADRKIFMNPMQGQLRIAGTVEFGGTGKPMNQQRALLLKDHALAGLDNLDTSGFTTWLGHRPCLPDSLPVIGPVANLPGLWTGFGHGHLGLTGSVNTGRLLARAMAGQTSANELAPFSLSRFR